MDELEGAQAVPLWDYEAMSTRSRFPIVSVVVAIVLVLIGLFLALGGTIGTTAASPLAGTPAQTMIVGSGIILAVAGAVLGITVSVRLFRS